MFGFGSKMKTAQAPQPQRYAAVPAQRPAQRPVYQAPERDCSTYVYTEECNQDGIGAGDGSVLCMCGMIHWN